MKLSGFKFNHVNCFPCKIKQRKYIICRPLNSLLMTWTDSKCFLFIRFRVAIVSLFRCGSCQKAQIGVSYPNQTEPHGAYCPQPMAPRSPLVGIARNIHGVVIHKELSVSYDSMFGVSRYREKLITVSSGLKIYSLEEQA